MASPQIDLRCLHCDTSLQKQEVMDGWCEACGKRVPPSYRDVFKGNAPAWLTPDVAPTSGGGGGRLLWCVLAVSLFICLAGAVVAVAAAKGG